MEIVNKFAPLAMAWIMFVVGTSTSINQFKEVIKFPKSLLLGFLTQVVFVPIIGIVIAYLSPVSDAYKIGILLLSCVPSAVMSNYLTKTINGVIDIGTGKTVFLRKLVEDFGINAENKLGSEMERIDNKADADILYKYGWKPTHDLYKYIESERLKGLN